MERAMEKEKAAVVRVRCGVCSHVVVMISHDCPGTPGRQAGESRESYQERVRIFVQKLRSSRVV